TKRYGKRVGKKMALYLSMFIMWVVICAWPGGGYNFIISSGILQFIYMVFEDMLTPGITKLNNKLGIRMDTFGYKLYQVMRTFILFSFAMIFFRAGTVSEGIHIIKSMFVFNPSILVDNVSLYTAGLDIQDFRVLIAALVILFSVELIQRRGSVREMLFRQNLIFRWFLILSLMFIVIIFGCYGPGYSEATFIYRQF
ncbi:MAG: MBOAT family protein, partial [Bacilli bacterium]|nr:MBOAT family protein [Bacilli bacterium]